MKNNAIYLLALSFSLGLVSCGGNNKNVSTATGWKINGKNGEFQYNTKFKKQETPIGMVAVEGGTFTMGKVQDDVMYDWNNTPNQQHVQSFYMDETEVTNMMYAEYLYYLKAVFPPSEENYKNIYKGALPDTLVWRDRLGYNEQMVTQYLWHPAYGNYPVVGVNWIQATEFCKWRTDFANLNLLEKAGYIKKDAKTKDMTAETYFSTEAYLTSPSTTFGGDESIVLKGPKGKLANDPEAKNVYASASSGIMNPEYRLPTEAEWEYAALALNENREYNLYRGKKKYPWSGTYTRSAQKRVMGDQLANYQQRKGDYGGPAGWSSDNADITAPVKSYPPNAFGLYDMGGNVNEWVLDVYRPIIDDEANDFNYHRGNVYMKHKIGPDGLVQFVTTDSIVYDTLSNGRIIARSLPGQIALVPIDENETYLRYNFDKSDNRNYRDGDNQSSRYYGGSSEEEGENSGSKKMYNSPAHKVETDSIGTLNKQYDKSNKRTTLIDDNSRVYKGGSWRDRAYWLDPAQRRYYPQDMATNDIGFRCAMSKVGPKTERKKPRG